MRDIDLYGQILGVTSPWEVTDVDLRLDAGEVEVSVSYEASAAMSCPKCGAASEVLLASEVPHIRRHLSRGYTSPHPASAGSEPLTGVAGPATSIVRCAPWFSSAWVSVIVPHQPHIRIKAQSRAVRLLPVALERPREPSGSPGLVHVVRDDRHRATREGANTLGLETWAHRRSKCEGDRSGPTQPRGLTSTSVRMPLRSPRIIQKLSVDRREPDP